MKILGASEDFFVASFFVASFSVGNLLFVFLVLFFAALKGPVVFADC